MCAGCAALPTPVVGLRLPEIMLQECNVLRAAGEMGRQARRNRFGRQWPSPIPFDPVHLPGLQRWDFPQYNHRLSSALNRRQAPKNVHFPIDCVDMNTSVRRTEVRNVVNRFGAGR